MTDKLNKDSWQDRKTKRGGRLPEKPAEPLADGFTPCEDERYLLDPGGGLALKEDHEDEGEDESWRRARNPGNRR